MLETILVMMTKTPMTRTMFIIIVVVGIVSVISVASNIIIIRRIAIA